MHSHVIGKENKASSQGVQGTGVFFQICFGRQPHLPRGVALSTCDRSVTGYISSVQGLHESRTIAFDTRRATVTCQPQKKEAARWRQESDWEGRFCSAQGAFAYCDRKMAMGVYTRGLVMTVWTALHIDCGSQAAVLFRPTLF